VHVQFPPALLEQIDRLLGQLVAAQCAKRSSKVYITCIDVNVHDVCTYVYTYHMLAYMLVVTSNAHYQRYYTSEHIRLLLKSITSLVMACCIQQSYVLVTRMFQTLSVHAVYDSVYAGKTDTSCC
jgi:hypothetical protein